MVDIWKTCKYGSQAWVDWLPYICLLFSGFTNVYHSAYMCLAYRFLKRKCSSIIWTNKHVHACSSHYNSVICQYNCHSADRQQIQELLTHTVNTVYLINWVQSPYGGKLVELDLFTCLYGSVHTREKKMRPIFPDTGQVWGQMIYYMAIYQSDRTLSRGNHCCAMHT